MVGCGCRGRQLARALSDDGHAVRGTTRDPAGAAAIERAGAEPVVADPDRLATLLPAIEGVSAICWLMGSAAGSPAAEPLNGSRLSSLLEHLVDAPVRGFVYEAAGAAGATTLARGAAIARAAADRYRIRVEVVDADPSGHEAWLGAARGAVARVLEDERRSQVRGGKSGAPRARHP